MPTYTPDHHAAQACSADFELQGGTVFVLGHEMGRGGGERNRKSKMNLIYLELNFK